MAVFWLKILCAIFVVVLLLKGVAKILRWIFQFDIIWLIIAAGAIGAIWYYWGAEPAAYAGIALVLYLICCIWE